MRKAILAGALSLLLLGQAALAEVYSGLTAASRTINIEAPCGGILESLNALPGQTVAAGESLGSLRSTKVFASQDGTVARIQATEGRESDGTVLEIAPVSQYTIYCIADKAYDKTSLIHSGEELFIQCTENGSHRGTGIVTQINSSEFQLEATGGEFYVGETVYLYRDAEFSRKQRVGIGTVVTAATETYEASGTIARIHVSEGEAVERGELLYEVIDGDSAQIAAETDGIITAISAQQGAQVQENQALLALAPLDSLCIEIQVEEAQLAEIRTGAEAAITYSCDPNETLIPGTVTEILQIAANGQYTVRIAPETLPTRIGLSATVRINP